MVKVRVTVGPDANLFHGRVILRCCNIPMETAQALVTSGPQFEFECATLEKARAAVLDLIDEGFAAVIHE